MGQGSRRNKGSTAMGQGKTEDVIMKLRDNSHGVSIIAAIFIIVILGFMGVIFVSLISTGSLTAVNDMQSTQALSIAEGGVEFARYNLSLDNNWYWNTDPESFARNLGSGQFTVDISYPATALRKNIGSGALAGGVPVFSVGNFPPAGFLYIGGEVIAYTAVVPGPPATFTVPGVGNRAQWGTAASPHSIGSPVYPVTRLTAAACAAPPCNNVTLTVGSTSKFLWRGTVTINPDDPLGDCGAGGTREDVDYVSLTANTFVGASLNCAHGANEIVTPVQTTDQAGITSTGMVSSSQRQVRNITER
jgi:hypothetical protein